jgi:hypothetical protein
MWKNLSIVATQFATKEQSKDVTDMFFLWIQCYKLYEEDVSSMFSHYNTCTILGWAKKNLTLKGKHKI